MMVPVSRFVISIAYFSKVSPSTPPWKLLHDSHPDIDHSTRWIVHSTALSRMKHSYQRWSRVHILWFQSPIFLNCHLRRPPDIDHTWQEFPLIKLQWLYFLFFALPILCVNINSILNPFLVALRHPKIKRKLKSIFIRCRTVLSESSAALVQHLHFHTNSVQQGNEIEIQDDENWTFAVILFHALGDSRKQQGQVIF